jgi:ribosomal protection tetracycline resistance protein
VHISTDPQDPRRILNLGILAHVDAGKTSLTERMLYTAAVIDQMGSVDTGNTQTDTLALERERGITIKSAVVSFAIRDVTVNLIDTPGHPDFIAEVERVLSVLDGAVLVISAVEGVQPQTRVLMRILKRLHIPTLLFINKIDRAGAQYETLLAGIAERLTPAIIAMGVLEGPGGRDARFTPYGPEDVPFTARLIEVLTEQDDTLLARYLKDEDSIDACLLRETLIQQTKAALVHPVFFGSAVTGAGTEELMDGIARLLPAAEGNPNGAVRGAVFKVERGPAGEKIAYVRMFSGRVRTRDRLQFGDGKEGKVTALSVFHRGPTAQSPEVRAGQIAKLWGLGDIRIGDTIGQMSAAPEVHYFPQPTLETAIVPVRPSDKPALHLALAQLAEADPLINLRQDDRRGELYVSLYGEVQKEVIEATLAQEYGLEAHFRETSVICIERPIGVGEGAEFIGKDGNLFLATLGFRVEPGSVGSGLELRLALELVTIPLYVYGSVAEFRAAIEGYVREALAQGLYGWQVTDCIVTLMECGYNSPSSTARDFRLLTPLVLLHALKEAGTQVFEPVHRFDLEFPADTYGATVAVLARLGAVPQSTAMRGTTCTLEGTVLAARVHELQHLLPGTTHGEGVLETSFDSYAPVSEPFPTRQRSDYNPLDRKEYLLHVVRRL